LFGLANPRALHLAQCRLDPTPSLRLHCVSPVLEIASLLSRMGDRQIAPRLAQLAGVLVNFHRLHVASSFVGDGEDMGAPQPAANGRHR
jgi:hypothetical protein